MGLPKRSKEVAYKSLVIPKLEYASTTWDPHYKKTLLLSKEHYEQYLSLGNYERTASVSAMIKELVWDPLESRRKISRLYKLSLGLLDLNTENVLTASREL